MVLPLLLAVASVVVSAAGEDAWARRGVCPITWAALDGMCYLGFPQALPWAEARDYCAGLGLGARLATVTSAMQLIGVQAAKMRLPGASAWIGFSEVP